MSHERRAEAAARVRTAYPPLPQIFAALRAALGAPESAPPPPPEPEPVAPGSNPADVALDAVRAGVEAARAAGVPDTGVDVDDVAADLLDIEDLDRLRAIGRSVGVVAAVRDTSWSVVQRFGNPWCPRSACYGRNGSLLTDARIATEGYPPYGDGCNCTAEPADLP